MKKCQFHPPPRNNLKPSRKHLNLPEKFLLPSPSHENCLTITEATSNNQTKSQALVKKYQSPSFSTPLQFLNPTEKISTPPEKISTPPKKISIPPEKSQPLPKKSQPPQKISQSPPKKFLNPPPRIFLNPLPPRTFLNPPPKNFSTPPRKFLNPPPPENFSTKAPPPKIS